MDFKIGQRYKGTYADGKTIVIEIMGFQDNKEVVFKVLEGSIYGPTHFTTDSYFATALELIPDLPRICYVLGGEKTPLKIGETFFVKGEHCKYFIDKNGFMQLQSGSESISGLYIAINHPERIIRAPQFSEDEKALMRGLVVAGFPWIARDENDAPCAFEKEPTKRSSGKWDSDYEYDDKIIPTEMLKQIAWENSPFNAAEYLEENK